LRCLLLHRAGPKSFKDLRTVNGIEYATFSDAAKQLGLLESDALFARAMQDACDEMPNFRRLQHYFAMLIFHSRPSDPQQLFYDFLEQMNPPLSVNNNSYPPKSYEMRKGEVMRNLEYFFNCMGTSCMYMFCICLFF
jgi:hypothetical protein